MPHKATCAYFEGAGDCTCQKIVWSEDEWTNLAQLSNKLSVLMNEPQRTNGLWLAKLRITLRSLSMYPPSDL